MRRLLVFLAWWIPLFFLWMAYQGEWDAYEWVAAAGAAAASAALGLAFAELGLLRFRIPLRLIRTVPSVVVQIPIDFAIVTFALVRRLIGRPVHGRFVVRRFDSPAGGAVAAGDRAARTVLAAYSPNAYPIDVDPAKHRVLLRVLRPNRKSEEPA